MVTSERGCGSSPGQPRWDRHVWLYRDNPNGLFAQFNPDVSCEHHQGATYVH